MRAVDYNILIDEELDWAVSVCEGQGSEVLINRGLQYSTRWDQAGPIIQREEIAVWPDPEVCGNWYASLNISMGVEAEGQTPLVAAMRVYVRRKLGRVVNVPNVVYKSY